MVVAQVDADRVPGGARVRVHVIPEDRDVVDATVRRDAVYPVEVRLQLDVVRLDVDVARSFADGDAIRMLGVLDRVVPDRRMLRADRGWPVAELDRLPLIRTCEIRDPHVLDHDVGAGPLDPEHRLGAPVQIPVDEPVADDVRVGNRTRPAADAVRGGELGLAPAGDPALGLEHRWIRQAVTPGSARAPTNPRA